MVKLLCDICLSVMQTSLDKVQDIGLYIPTVYKEKLIERLAWHDMFTPQYIPYISEHLFSRSLRRINFYQCEQIDDAVCQLIESSQCKLEYLTINRCVHVTDKGLLSCTRNQDELISIKLRKLKNISDAGLKCIRSPVLKTVDLKSCSKITFEGVRYLAEINPGIKELYLAGIHEVHSGTSVANKSTEHSRHKHSQIISIAQCLNQNLEVLVTQLNQMCDECLVAVAKYCPNMKQLNIHGSSRISGEALTKFCMGCTSLESLDLSYCSSLCDSPSVEALWTLPTSLTELSLTGVQLMDERIFVECLQRLQSIKTVRLCGVAALNDKTLAEVLQYVGHSLTSLDLSGGMANQITDDGLSAIPLYCTSVEELMFRLLSNVTCKNILPMFKDPIRAAKFRKLFLSVRELCPDVLYEVTRSCCNLEKLDLSGLACVDDNTLISLSKNCKKLEDLSIKSCRQVTDRGVCELVRCCSFRTIVLAGINNLTDKSIFALANSCHYLKEIYLNGCAYISPAAVRYLVDCTIPRLWYMHVTPNVQPDQLMARNLDTGEFCRADIINDSLM